MRLLPAAPLALALILGRVSSEKHEVRQGECRVNMDTGSYPPWPAIMTRTNGDLVKPESNRDLVWSPGETFDMSCSGKTFEFSGAEFESATCSDSTLFDTSVGLLDFSQMGCDSEPSDDTSEPGNSCGPGSSGIEVDMGFQLESSFYASATACFEEASAYKNIYSSHYLWKEIGAQDTGNDRPSFRTGGYFPFDVDDAYSQATQYDTIDQLTGRGDDYVDANANIYLSRGHLSPNAAFLYYTLQDATFYFVNVAPQWQNFNAGNWADIEDEARTYVENHGNDLKSYTGTHGVLALDDTNDNPVDIYLEPPSSLPVPLYFWKVLVDENANAGVAIVGTNDPYMDPADVGNKVCSPVSHTITDGLSQPDDVVLGVTYACAVDDLMAVFEEIPSSLAGLSMLPN